MFIKSCPRNGQKPLKPAFSNTDKSEAALTQNLIELNLFLVLATGKEIIIASN